MKALVFHINPFFVLDACAMTTRLKIGMKAKTLGPLKPSGRISVDGHAMDASSDGNWIDGDEVVVIVGGDQRQPIVRVLANDLVSSQNHGQPLPDRIAMEATPLQAPPGWVERLPAVKIGIAIGIVLVSVAWILGTPLSWSTLLVPASCAAAGWLFHFFVSRATETVGPREDHRPQARATALIVLCCSLVGAMIGITMGAGFLGLACGIPVGAAVGGMLTFAGWIISNL